VKPTSTPATSVIALSAPGAPSKGHAEGPRARGFGRLRGCEHGQQQYNDLRQCAEF
jgi:hypothetical protein